MRCFSTLLRLSIFSLCLLIFAGCATKIHNTLSGYSESLPDGMYLVLRTGNLDKEIMPLAENERIITFNQLFFEKTDQDKQYVVVKNVDYVPLSLQAMPEESVLEDKRKTLLLSLTDDAKDQLRQFTTDNLNQMTGIVVGGKMLTMHKIRTVIDSGKLQISRCGDNACELLYVELQDNVVK